MKPSFKDTFISDNEKKYQLSKQFIDFLNKSAPINTQYELIKGGKIILNPKKGEKMQVSGLEIIKPEAAIDIFKKYGSDAVFRYSYNSQEALELKPINNNIKINGETINFNKFIIDFDVDRVNKKKNRLIINPPPFDNPKIIELSNGKVKYKVKLFRIPNNKYEEEIYESDKEKPLSLEVRLNSSSKKSIYSLTVDLKKTSSIKEIIDILTLYDAFIKNGLYINNSFKITSNEENKTNFNEVSILFWKKALKVQKKIGKKFKVVASELNDKQVLDVETLYQNLIKKKPIRKNTYITKMSIKDVDVNALEGLKEKSVVFDFCDIDEVNIFNTKIKLYTIYNVLYIKPYIISKRESETVIKFEPADNLPTPYTSYLSFLNEREMNDYFKNNLKNNRKKFQNAKTTVEYVEESINI